MSQFPRGAHENIAQQAAHEASSAGRSGCASRSTYSTGGAGIASIHVDAPARKRAIIEREVSSHPAAIVAPARLMPTVRVKRSSSIVSSPKSSERRPFACFRAIHLEEALPGGDEPLREPQVVERARREVRDAVTVAEDLDRVLRGR